jgi:hypothetical protein
MNGRHFSFVIATGLVTAVPVFAEDFKSPAFTPREMAHCVMQRLRANAAESYRSAFKTCKEEFAVVRSDRPGEAVITAAALPKQ